MAKQRIKPSVHSHQQKKSHRKMMFGFGLFSVMNLVRVELLMPSVTSPWADFYSCVF